MDIEEVDRDEIQSYLDTPRDGAIESSRVLLLSGWACSPAGIMRISTHIDGVQTGKLRSGLGRPDVAEHLPRVPGAGQSGFAGEIDVRGLGDGTHHLQVVIEDQNGRRRIDSAVFHIVVDEDLYRAYYEADQLRPAEVAELVSEADRRGGPPITLWVEAGDREAEQLEASLRSVAEQSYPHLRCVVMVDVLPGSYARDERFERVDRGAFVTRPALPDSYSGILEAGEVLSPQALLRLAARLDVERPDLLYSDHDAIDATGRHALPWFNPDWSPDYLLARNFVGGFFLFRDELRTLAPAGRHDGPAWRHDLLLHLTDGPAVIAHEPHLLWSRPIVAKSSGEAVFAAELEATRDALARRGQKASAMPTDSAGVRRCRWEVTSSPLVSIVVPTTGNMRFVEPLVRSLTLTSYRNYELVVIDNGRGRHRDGIDLLRESGAVIVERDVEFNWAQLNNDGARAAKGDLLLFLNDDIEIVDPDWLTELVGQAQRPEIGAVGGLLLYPDGRIQHAGVFFVDYGGGAVHLFHGRRPEDDLYLDLQHVQREVAALTGACLMIRRLLFEEMGGFDERLRVAGNDMDLCLRLLGRGLRNIWTPHARLVHHESATRRETSISGDETTMWQLWGDWLRAGDPYHSRHFAKDRVDCAIDYRRLNVSGRRPYGINLIGYIRAEMGVGEATRGTASALEVAGIPFTLIEYRHGNPARMGDDSWARRLNREAIYAVNLIYVNAEQTPEVFGRLPAGTLTGRYTIGNWTWELPDFPDEWLGSFSYVDEVWVPSTFVHEAVTAKSPVPVTVVPHAVRAPSGPFSSRSELGLPEDPYLFLMMYDVHSVRERKNPAGAIDAFRRAFEEVDASVRLVIKVNNADRAERRFLRELARARPNIQIIDRTLQRHEVDSLIAACDCFVSLHRSEGFGLAIAEAMALGKPVVATNWSGNTDYMDEHSAAGVRYRLIELEQDYGPYRAGNTWADPDLDHAAEWMAMLSSDRSASNALGYHAAERIAALTDRAVIGGLIGQRLSEMQRLSAGPRWSQLELDD